MRVGLRHDLARHPKTIAIDYTPAIRQQAGIGRIIRGQIAALFNEIDNGQIPYDVRLFVAGPVTSGDRASAPRPVHSTPIRERDLVRLWHRLNLPFPQVEWFTGGPLDLFHATDFVLAPTSARRKIVTVHDLAFLFYPEAAMPGLQRYLNEVVPRSVHRADHIIADSANTARDLHQQWDIDSARISVVQGAVDHAHFRPVTDRNAQARVRHKYEIGDGPFILAVSRLEPRKNHARLIQAFDIARRCADLPHRLIIGGAKGWLFDDIFAQAERLQLGDRVHFPGFIDDADLPALYSAAEFLAYPSLYEGFGLPIVEALACGIPVLTGDNSCLPEAGGPGAFYVKVEDVDALASAIKALASDAKLRQNLAQAGRIHALGFSWENSARQLMQVYERVLAGD
jgi:glycosyltransferase involved in cell wall biosynthesis